MQKLLLTPPSGYQAVEEGLYRCHGPLAPKHIPFLESLSITAIVNVSSEPIFVPSSSSSNSGIDLSAIAMHNIPMDLTSNTIHLQTIFDALELIFSLHKFKILLIGDTKLNFDCLLVACIRRLQRFSMTSLLSEYRFNSTLRNFDAEQLIESLDRESMLLACCSTHIPSYIEAFAKENKVKKRLLFPLILTL